MAEALVRPCPASIAALLCQATRTLRAAGIERARAEARLLLAHCLGVEPASLIGRAHDHADPPGFAALVARRAAREPMAYLLGVREFRGLGFRVTPDTLIPRPESETLIDAAVELLAGRGEVRRVLDLGTGSGCLLCAALKAFPDATGLGIDRSGAALRIARDNACALGLGARAMFAQAHWLEAVAARFDLVLANPPYVAAADVAALAPELRHEPPAALVAGADGLDAFRAIMPGLGRVLAPGGVAILELGAGQAAPVSALAGMAGLRVAALRHDLAGIPRAIVLRAVLPLG